MLKFLKTCILNPFLLLGLAFIVAFHQFIYWGKWFELSDIHHETFMVALVFGAIVLIVWRGLRSWD